MIDDPDGLLTVGTSLAEKELWSRGGDAMWLFCGDMATDEGSAELSEMYLRSSEWRKDCGRLPIVVTSLDLLDDDPLIADMLCWCR